MSPSTEATLQKATKKRTANEGRKRMVLVIITWFSSTFDHVVIGSPQEKHRGNGKSEGRQA